MQRNELKKLIQEVKLQEALQRGIKQVAHPFKAVFILGPAGSGKTHIKDSVLNLPDYFVSANTDELVEEVFPRFKLSLNFEEGEQEVKQELRKLLQQATSNIAKQEVNKCKPILFDTTGEKIGKMKKIIHGLVEIGYDVAIFQVNVPPDFSVFTDQKRGEKGGRTIGRKMTRQIANDYQINVVKWAAYLQLAQERGVTLLADNVYPNLFDTSTGELRSSFDAKILQDEKLELKDPNNARPSKYMHNPFKGASWDEARQILETAQSNLEKWLANDLPANPTGKSLYKALAYVQDQGKGTLGDEITDIPQYAAWAIKNDVPIPKEVDEALYLTVGVKTKIQKTVPGEKHAEYDPKYSPLKVKYKGPEYGKKGAPTGREITKRKPLSEGINYLRCLIHKIIKES